MNIKNVLVGSVAGAFMLGSLVVPAFASGGFDQYGYNDTARIFNGTGASWSLAKGLPANYLGIYANDQLIMKWNAQWDTCNAAKSVDPSACKGATLTNEWNGMVPGGSGETEHFKAVWFTAESCGADYAPLPNGGYCIWSHYEALMDQGMTDGSHWVIAHATPNGFGVDGTH